MAPIPNALEACDAIIVTDDRLAVDDAGSRAQAGQRLDDQGEAVRQVVAEGNRAALVWRRISRLSRKKPKWCATTLTWTSGAGHAFRYERVCVCFCFRRAGKVSVAGGCRQTHVSGDSRSHDYRECVAVAGDAGLCIRHMPINRGEIVRHATLLR
jgi:hypothetical protein